MNRKRISLLLAAVLLLSLSLPATAAEAVKPYGAPWLTSIVDGMVTAELPKPDVKDDFFLSNNYEWLCGTVLKPGQAKTGAFDDISDLVDEQVATLFTDESITGREAEMVREFIRCSWTGTPAPRDGHSSSRISSRFRILPRWRI